MPEPNCPKCGLPLSYDSWEDMYCCIREPEVLFFYPEELGLTTNQAAPIFKNLSDEGINAGK
jgi:hypothetical protein